MNWSKDRGSLAHQIENVSRAKRKISYASFTAVRVECSNKILHAAKFDKDEFIVFEVPSFIIGYPVFDRAECVNHLIKYFKKMKMQAELIPPFTLCISWNDKICVSEIVNSVMGNNKRSETTTTPIHDNTRSSANTVEKLAKIELKLRTPLTDVHKSTSSYISKRPPIQLMNAMSNKYSTYH